jgi:hypothetical protein
MSIRFKFKNEAFVNIETDDAFLSLWLELEFEWFLLCISYSCFADRGLYYTVVLFSIAVRYSDVGWWMSYYCRFSCPSGTFQVTYINNFQLKFQGALYYISTIPYT